MGIVNFHPTSLLFFLPGVNLFLLQEEDDDGWPFLDICEVLCNELFSKVWEIRHGAATLLRQIVKQCGYSAGVVNPDSVSIK